MDVFNLLQHGIAAEYGLTAMRIATGTFFTLSGFNKLTNVGRHAEIAATMVRDKVPLPRVMEWFVPTWETLAGASLAVGLLTTFASAVLGVIMAVAICCEGRSRVAAYKPINAADWLDDWLYLPEVLYAVMLAVCFFAGGGPFSIDALF